MTESMQVDETGKKKDCPPCENVVQLSLDHEIRNYVVPIIGIRDDYQYTCGTGFFIAPRIVLTAWHVIEGIIKVLSPELFNNYQLSGKINIDFGIEVLRTLVNGDQFVHRSVHIQRCTFSADIAVLLMAPPTEAEKALLIRTPLIDLLPPTVGQSVTGYGYPETRIEAPDPNAPNSIKLNINPCSSSGQVTQIYAVSYLNESPLPSFEADTDFPPGMSGGPIVNEQGQICGLVSRGGHFVDEDIRCHYYGIAASLWPVLAEVIEHHSLLDNRRVTISQLCTVPLSPHGFPYIRAMNANCCTIGVHSTPESGDFIELVLSDGQRHRITSAEDGSSENSADRR